MDQVSMDTSETDSAPSESESTDHLASLSSNWCLSKSTTLVCPFVWAIENFSFYLCKDDPTVHRSEIFVAPELYPRQWYLTMECRKKNEKERQALFTIRMTTPVPLKLKAKIKFSFLDSNGTSLIDKESEDICTFTGNDQGWSWNIPHKYLVDLVNDEKKNSNDKFIVKCQVTVLTDSVNLSSTKRKSLFEIPNGRFIEDFRELYHTGNYADVIINVSHREFHVHKAILASRSSVFNAMFGHANTKEALENRVLIEDISPTIFEQLLRYIYTDNVENIENYSTDLLMAANKYGLDRLKALCEESITQQLTVDTAASILVLADLHCASQLKEFTIDFINKYPQKVLKTDGWKRLVQPNGQLVSEVFTKLVETIHSSPSNKQQAVVAGKLQLASLVEQ